MKSNERKEQIIIAVKALSPVLLFMAVVIIRTIFIIRDALP